MARTILIYAAALAGLALLLQAVQYTYHVRILPAEAYAVSIALLFTAVGIWAGRRLAGGGRQAPFERNTRAIEYLGISEREVEVLEWLGKGHSNQEIAEGLYVSANTVKTHLKHLYEKLGVGRRTQAVGKARELRLIP